MINQEEYEVLKELGDKRKWIARDGECNSLNVFSVKPIKVHSQWDYMDVGYEHVGLTREENKMFQFVQWEDEEPHSIAELIEEYEGRGDIVYAAKEYAEYISKFSEKLLTEMEEEEMKKDKEWLKEEIESKFHRWYNSTQSLNSLVADVNNSINQLDEPKVLSEEWIENKKWQAYDPDARTLYWAVTETDLENLLVPKQELPVIPKYVADWIEGNKQSEEKWSDYDKEDAMNDTIHFTIYGLFADYPATNSHVELRNPVLKWLSVDRGNYFKLVNAVRYGYEVEEEPLYRARLKVITDKFIASYLRTQSSDAKYRLKALEIGSKYIHEDHRHLSEFTENELKRLGIWGSEQWEVEELEVEGEEDER